MEQIPAVHIVPHDRYNELLAAEEALKVLKAEKRPVYVSKEAKDKIAEEEVKDTTLVTTHTHEDKPYALISVSKIKVRGMLDKFAAHPLLKPAIDLLTPQQREDLSTKWLPATIYKSLENEELYVRMLEEFNSEFKPV